MHFERVLKDKRYKELEAEYESCFRLVNMKISMKMLIQAREVYTNKIFEDFQDQFEDAVDLFIVGSVVDEGITFYEVKKYDHIKKQPVGRETNNSLSCSCRMFEKVGILCSHVLKVLRDSLDIKAFIPSQYIFKKWTKQARAECVQDMNGREILIDPKLQQTC